MKALTIKQPWASLIVEGIKDIENRTWRTNFRGRIYLHSSASKVNFKTWYDSPLTNDQLLALPSEWCECEDFLYSAIIGEVDIIDCVLNHASIWAEHKAVKIKEDNGVKTEVDVPVWNWVLANPVKYDHPILDVKGALSFWQPCERCKQEAATAKYSDLHVCEHCSNKLNDYFDEEYR